MPKLSVPTPPITAALVAGTPALLRVLRDLGKQDPALAEAVRRYESEMQRVQAAAEVVTQIIEKRLKAVESAAQDVINGTGLVIRLSDDAPLPVGASASASTTNKSSRSGHVHVGVHAIDGHVGDLTTLDEAPAGTKDGVNDTFTLSRAPFWGLLDLNGQNLIGGGEDYTLTGATIVYVAGKIPAADDNHRFRGIA